MLGRSIMIFTVRFQELVLVPTLTQEVCDKQCGCYKCLIIILTLLYTDIAAAQRAMSRMCQCCCFGGCAMKCIWCPPDCCKCTIVRSHA